MQQNNGGKVVQLEKFADVVIADHAKKDAPNGSVSWKYLQDSVRAGRLLDINDYTKQSGLTQRPVGSTQPTKSTRTAFTAGDDQLLARWVLQQERLGEKPSGAKIYQEFAEKVSAPRGLARYARADVQSTRITRGSHGETDG